MQNDAYISFQAKYVILVIMESLYYQKEYVRRASFPDVYKEIKAHFIDFHTMTVLSDFDYPPHHHAEYELIWVQKGPYSCLLNDEAISIDSDKVLIIKPGDTHSDILKTGQSHIVLHFSLEGSLFRPGLSAAQQSSVSKLTEAAEILKKLRMESDQSDSVSQFSGAVQDALMETLFWYSIRILPKESLSERFTLYSLKQQFSSRLYALFAEHVGRPLSVDNIANEMSMSVRNLSLKCKKLLHSSPGRLYLQFRLDTARQEIDRTNKTFNEISLETGFENQFDFSRAFKRLYGKSPASYRKEISAHLQNKNNTTSVQALSR